MNKLLASAAALLLAGAANAAVVGVSITAPVGATWTNYVGAGPIGNNSFDNNNTIYTMDENQNVTLAAPLAVKAGVTPTLAAGTKVASHYVWFDPKKVLNGVADITFDRKILGVIIDRAGLMASEGALGLSGVTYLYPAYVGLEPNAGPGGGDWSSFVTGSNTLHIDFLASSPGDHIRVITAAVPVPAAGGLLALGLAGLAALRRRKSA